MPEPELIVIVVREWIKKAENDLRTAAYTLTMGEEAPTDTICFHAQQCVEKYLKALLVSLFIPFPKTHDVSELLGLIPGDLRPELEVSVQKRLTEYAIAPRYPNAGLDISIREARKAVAVARRVRKEVRRLLPRASLRQPKK